MSDEYIIERRMKQQKLRRKARRGEIALRRLYKFIRFLFVLAIFYGIYRLSIVHYWYFPSNLFSNPKEPRVEILGNNIVPSSRIISEIKKIPVANLPLYKINPAPVARQIEELSPIRRAYIRRYWFPARYVVMIEEVVPAIVISPSETAPEVIAFAHSGERIGREYLPFKFNSGVVKVLSYGTKGDDYNSWDVDKIKEIYRLSSELEDYSGEKVQYIDLRNPHDVFVQLQSVRIRIGAVDPSVFERIKSIHEILPEIKKMKEKVKYVDLSWKESKYLKME